MSPIEVSWLQIEKGQERLYVNMLYALCDEAGEHALTQALVSDLRRQVLSYAKLIGEHNLPLSAAWWGQLGNEAKAVKVETSNSLARSGHAKASGRLNPTHRDSRWRAYWKK
eukprot:6179551-Pleurochrysis_carterae.AAC.1